MNFCRKWTICRNLYRYITVFLCGLFWIFCFSCNGQSGNTSRVIIDTETNVSIRNESIIDKTTNAIQPITKEQAAEWVQEHFTEYYQEYNLSCEAALMRLVCNLLGITDLSEDDILSLLPRHPTDPNLGLVMKDINGSIYREDGSIDWSNYGAHAPVVIATLSKILMDKGYDEVYAFENRTLSDSELIRFLKADNNCIGAIIWVAAYVDGEKPEQNAIGQVEGEHVQFVSPLLDSQSRMLVYDVWPWKNQPFHLAHPFNRELFGNSVIIIRRISG